MDIIIRDVRLEDAASLLEIYGPYVKETAITFEYEVPSVDEFKARIENITKKYPYFVAELEGKIVGYCYAGIFKARAAYDWAVETTIYVKKDLRRSGVGRKLYAKLEEALKAQGILNLCACIACPREGNEYLTDDSIRFHESLGYELVGRFHQCGYKFDHWFDMVWMEKMVGEHGSGQMAIKAYSEI
ncbi:MAG: N-acetyltransferase family protein [Pseudobutyrivibrio sp.]|nr:N-acetyltransferase family protein [Pseudobutyrivibrio sp.]